MCDIQPKENNSSKIKSYHHHPYVVCKLNTKTEAFIIFIIRIIIEYFCEVQNEENSLNISLKSQKERSAT